MLSEGVGARADLRLRRLRAPLPQATCQVRPQGASGANAPPASLLPSSPGGCTVVHPYKRLIANCISDASWSVSTSVGWVSARLSALLYCFEEEVGVLAGDGY